MKIRAWLVVLLALSSISCHTAVPADDPEETTSNALKITGNYEGCAIGVFPCGGDITSSEINAFESGISKEVSVAMWFIGFDSAFPSITCGMVSDHKAVPMLTWMPKEWGTGEEMILSGIKNGDYDSYIRKFADDVKAWGKPLFIRWGHEMNGNWYGWSASFNGSNDAATTLYKDSWRHIHDIFNDRGATNVTWVFSPNRVSVPDETWNEISDYYPGDSYVDWVAFDGYSSHQGWMDFDGLAGSAYTELTGSQYGNKPLMIGEFSCSTPESGQPLYDKRAWINDTFDQIKTNYPEIKLFVWFNPAKEESWGGTWYFFDWRYNSTTACATTFAAGLNDEHYISTIR